MHAMRLVSYIYDELFVFCMSPCVLLNLIGDIDSYANSFCYDNF